MSTPPRRFQRSERRPAPRPVENEGSPRDITALPDLVQGRVRPDHDLRDASEAMARHGVTHIVVTARGDATPIGILSSLDIARAAGAKASR